MTTTERREAILKLLCKRRFETRLIIAEEFEVSERTIDRDLFILSQKYPIYLKAGRYGGVHIADWFNLYTVKLNPRQIVLLEKLLETLRGKDRETMLAILKQCR